MSEITIFANLKSMKKSPTYIDGIGSSQAIDTTGEIVDLKGLDITSLVGAAFNFEHESKLPSQIVGKIMEAKKIFSADDCENDRHKFFWNKCKLPFLYVMGRLFDDKKESSKEIAALFLDDAEHPTERDMVGFSVEGAKIEKVGAVITRSIARKVTITHIPANKTCIAEILPDKKAPKGDDFSSLFKGELELFSFDPTYIQILEKKEELKKGESGAFVGDSMAMNEDKDLKKSTGWSKPNITRGKVDAGMHFNHPVGGTLSVTKHPKGHLDVSHNKQSKGSFKTPHEAGKFANKYMSDYGKSEEMNKALSAGSGMAAPSSLVGISALSVESLEGTKKDKPTSIKQAKSKSVEKAEKTDWYSRAEESYKGWDKKNKFKEYIKKRMPNLAEGEIDAIGRVLALKKNVQSEKNLNSMYARNYGKDKDMEKAENTHIHGLPKDHPSLGEHKGHIYRRTSPPVEGANHWTWSVRSPEGKDSKVHLPAETAGSRDALHAHIDSNHGKKK